MRRLSTFFVIFVTHIDIKRSITSFLMHVNQTKIDDYERF